MPDYFISLIYLYVKQEEKIHWCNKTKYTCIEYALNILCNVASQIHYLNLYKLHEYILNKFEIYSLTKTLNMFFSVASQVNIYYLYFWYFKWTIQVQVMEKHVAMINSWYLFLKQDKKYFCAARKRGQQKASKKNMKTSK